MTDGRRRLGGVLAGLEAREITEPRTESSEELLRTYEEFYRSHIDIVALMHDRITELLQEMRETLGGGGGGGGR